MDRAQASAVRDRSHHLAPRRPAGGRRTRHRGRYDHLPGAKLVDRITFPKPDGKPTFTCDWFKWFFTLGTLPGGHPIQWAPHLLLITDEFFKPELQHLLVVIPKGSWKTAWEGRLGAWHLVTVNSPRVDAGAENLTQADELLSFVQHYVEESAFMSSRLIVRPSTREIRVADGGKQDKLQLLAGDKSKGGGKKQGRNTTLGLADEPHAYENANLWTDITSGGFKRREAARMAGDPLWWTIGKDVSTTTAGHDIDGPLGQEITKYLGDHKKGTPPLGTVETGLRVVADPGSEKGYRLERHPEGRLTIARSPTGGSVMLQWALTKDDDWRNPRVVKFANPAPTVTVESLADAQEKMTEGQYKRYRANLWTEGGESWLPDGAWPNLRSDTVPVVVHRTWEDATWTGLLDERNNPILVDEEDADGNVILAAMLPDFREFILSLFPAGTTNLAGALDMARYRDTAAVMAIGEHEGKRLPRLIVWRSGGHNNPIRYEWPKVAILALHRVYGFKAFGFDPKWSDQMGEELRHHGVPTEDFPQSPERMGMADTELRKDILAGEFVHDGDPVLTAHIQAGAEKYVGPKVILVQQQPRVTNPPPIDGCKALSMANELWKLEPEAIEPMVAFG